MDKIQDMVERDENADKRLINRSWIAEKCTKQWNEEQSLAVVRLKLF